MKLTCRDGFNIALVKGAHPAGHARRVITRAASELADRGREIRGALIADGNRQGVAILTGQSLA